MFPDFEKFNILKKHSEIIYSSSVYLTDFEQNILQKSFNKQITKKPKLPFRK
jgi:hypothetical protein